MTASALKNESSSPPGNIPQELANGSGNGGAGLIGEESKTQAQAQKKRRIPGACDICKKKKIRCDSGEMPGNRCSNCIQYGLECTHKEVTKTLGSAKGYVESLEARLEKMDKLLTKLLPGIDLSEEVDKLLDETDVSGPLPRIEDDEQLGTIGKLAKLDLNPPQNRFFGKSSGYQLIQTALDLKSQYNGDWGMTGQAVLKYRRPEFWDVPPWWAFNPETEEVKRQYNFPDDDLMASLIEYYFVQINPFLPLLHRPTFQRGVDHGLHLTDGNFGATVLLVCALGSRYSDDPRVFVEGSNSTLSAGWKWYEQVRVLRTSFFNRTSLYELQAYALSVLFGQSSETPQGCWSQVGMALRLAQEVGAHRRRSQNNSPTPEEELWKRAFWVLVSIDRLTSSFSGRPCGLQDEDFDLDLPVECDDEYWENPDPTQCFKQPPGQPSSIAFFKCYLSLMDILAYAMRVIYSIKRPKNMFGRVIQRSEQQIIAELDSAMNNWMDSVPQHLRWNPSCNNQLFLKQSAALFATYYHLQIFIHRPFIPSPRNRTPVTFPSLAICTNAARSCCHVLESYSRLSDLPLPHLQITAFTAAVILLLNIWSGKRTGFAPNPRREMEDVQRCMNMLKSCEKRWSSAGRYCDILMELAYAGDVTINDSPPSSTPKSRKRRRTVSNDFACSPFSSPTMSGSSAQSPGSTSPPSHVSSIPSPASPTSPQSPQIPDAPPNFSLPMYSTELGRLPIYGQFNFLDTIAASPETTRQMQTAFPAAPAFPGHFFSQQQLLHAQAQTQTDVNLSQLQQQQSVPVLEPRYSTAEKLSSFSNTLPLGAMFDRQLTGTLYPQMIPPGAVSLPNPGVAATTTTMSTGRVSPVMNAAAVAPTAAVRDDGLGAGTGAVGSGLLDNDTMTMWSTAPTSFELDEWGSYISSVNQMTHGLGQAYPSAQTPTGSGANNESSS